ncbi:MAG: trypsin-like peptidase domain-containing protein [Clostridiales bacterium]|nr:trypsin-like peptidase domain-containing protein [Clostridiales bacterium]
MSETNETNKAGKRRTGLIAAFVTIALILTVATGAAVYYGINSLTPERLGLAITESTSTDDSLTSETGETGKDISSGRSGKSFSLESSAARTDTDREALSITQIVAQGKPAVVAIDTETTVATPFGRNSIIPSAGSGFIISADGYVVTNHHVISGAQSIQVTLDNGDTYKASLVGSDPANDIAVLKIDGADLPSVQLGDSSDLEVGELAVAIGNPLGQLSGTVTAGIISALDRTITVDGQDMTLLQTDAAINAGNSGGALFNSFGEVIGINTAKNSGSGIEGLGFAIPIDHAEPIIEQLIEKGSVPEPPRIGIYTQDVTAEMAQQYDLPEGVYVVQVGEGSPAAAAGIQRGDVIIAINGQETLTTSAINAVKNTLQAGDTMTLTIIRDGEKLEIPVVLAEATT